MKSLKTEKSGLRRKKGGVIAVGPNSGEEKASSLRRRAEEILRKKNPATDEVVSEEARKLIEELRIHQIELEMQNQELQRAQLEIEESRSKYVDLYEFSPVGYLTLNRRGVVEEANLTACDLLGTHRRSLLGLTFFQFVTPDMMPDYLKHKRGLLKTGAKHIFEITLRRPTEATFWAEFVCSGTKDSSGVVSRIQCAFVDISPRKVHEEAARWTFAYRQAIDHSLPLGLAAWDLTGRMTYANQTFCRMLGRSEEELMESATAVFWPSQDLGTISQAFEDLRNREIGEWAGDLRLLRKDGTFLETSVRLSALEDVEGQMLGWVSSFENVTAQRQIEKERLRLAAAVEQAGEGVAITSTEGIIAYTNPSFRRIVGHPELDFIGQNYLGLLSGGDGSADLPGKFERAMKCGESLETHLTRKTEVGQSQDLEIAFSPICDPSGNVMNVLTLLRDTTQQLKLDQIVRQAQKLEALGTLAGGIAHDFNNILMPIIINTEMALLDLPEGNPIRASLELVLSSASRGKQLVKQIVTFSRQKEHGRQPLKVSPLLKEALKFLRSSLPKAVELHWQIQEEDDVVLADPSQIHQIIMNLCTNASEMMVEAGGMIEVGLVKEEVGRIRPAALHELRPGSYLKLTVSDTGPGLEHEVLEKIFDPFFTTRGPGQGSGLGLPVVLGIVKAMGGAVVAESEVGKGSKFSIYMPLMEGEALKPEERPEEIPRGSGRILVVDDEPLQLDTYGKVLKRLGYQVKVEADSRSALALFRENPSAFDLVITDQLMPELSGINLAKELVRLRPGLPIILVSGFSDTLDASVARAAGVAEFLMKPFSTKDIARTIARALKKLGDVPQRDTLKGQKRGRG